MNKIASWQIKEKFIRQANKVAYQQLICNWPAREHKEKGSWCSTKKAEHKLFFHIKNSDESLSYIITINQACNISTTNPNALQDTKNLFVHPPFGASKGIQSLLNRHFREILKSNNFIWWCIGTIYEVQVPLAIRSEYSMWLTIHNKLSILRTKILNNNLEHHFIILEEQSSQHCRSQTTYAHTGT